MDIKEYIKKNHLIFDGAMGTYFAELKKNPLIKCEMANIDDPTTIINIHKEYIKSGCKAIKTNTFGANEISLEKDFDFVEIIIKKGYEIAMDAANGQEVFVFADIGPIPSNDDEKLYFFYKDIVDVFLSVGAVNFLFETFSSTDCLTEISDYIKSRSPNAFILTSFAVSPDGYTRQGNSGIKIFEEISRHKNIDALGFNCVSGPYHLLQFIKKVNIKDKIVSIMPNAGYPTVINNRTFFENNAAYFAMQIAEIAKEGVYIVGGCCGTNPEFIEETVREVKKIGTANIERIERIVETKIETTPQVNTLIEKMNSGNKIIAVELDPPMDTKIDFFMESAKKLKDYGVDAITIADCPIARARVDSSVLACKIKRELDITALPHMTCRDRNINATKALLLGLTIEGVNNVLVVTGDPIPSAEKNEVKGIFNFNSAMLAKYIKSLNETIFDTPFNICGALNVNATNFESQLKYAQKKIDSGVSMFLTQPILTEQAFENLKKASEVLDAKIVGGIIPVVSYRNACFMNNEIAGINVSDEIINKYKDISKEEADKLAVDISVKIAFDIEPYVDGFYLMTPFKRIDIICSILDIIRNKEK